MKLGKVDGSKSEVEMEGKGVGVSSLAGGKAGVLLGITEKELNVKTHPVEGEKVVCGERGIGRKEELLIAGSMMSKDNNGKLPLEGAMPADVTIKGDAFLFGGRDDLKAFDCGEVDLAIVLARSSSRTWSCLRRGCDIPEVGILTKLANDIDAPLGGVV